MDLWFTIKEALLKKPKQTVNENEASMSYEELALFAERFAKKLDKQKCCAILCSSEMVTSMALLSCFAAGITAVPLSMRYGWKHCEKILDTVDPTGIITDSDGELKVMNNNGSAYREPDIHPALIMCTSGTTGHPKGAMLSEQNILVNLSDIGHYFSIDETDTILISRPLYHCAVLTGEFLTALLKGSKICFHSEEFNPKRILDLMEEKEITVFGATPTLLNMLSFFVNKRRLPLKTICVSGECMNIMVAQNIREAFPNASIYHVYGLTEACPRISYLPPKYFDEMPDSVGIPLNSLSIKILKEDGTIAEIDETGTLWVHGGNIMIGYYNDPVQTARVLKDGWLCTGDLAVSDEKGFLKIKGRKDDLIIRSGMNIYPQEIEATLRTDPRVKEVFVYRMDHPVLGCLIGMKIAGDFADKNEVHRLCMELLPPFQIPTAIELVPELPKSGSGKIIRKQGGDKSENDFK